MRPPPAPRAAAAFPGLSLRRNFSWTLAGTLFYGGCQWATLVVLAKVGTAGMVGQFALALAIVTPAIAFGNLQLRYLQCTDARSEFCFGDYLGLRLLTAFLVLAGIALTPFVGGYPRATAGVILAVALARSFDSVSDIFYGMFQQRECMDRIAISSMVRGVLQLLALGVVVLLTHSIALGVLATALISAAVLVGYDLPSARFIAHRTPERAPCVSERTGRTDTGFRPRWERAALLRLAWLGLPMGFVMALNSLIASIPRYVIAGRLGDRDLGLFAAMFYLTLGGSMVTGAMSDTAIPRLARQFAGGDNAAFCRLLLRLLAIAAVIGGAGAVVAWIAGARVLTVVYRPEYAAHPRVLIWLMAYSGVMSICTLLGAAVTALRRFHIQVPLPTLGVVLTYWLSLCWIPRYGLEGAGMAMLTNAVFVALSTAVLVLISLREGVRG
jgi:O-antigen/teichoic acid export membrane protein